MSEQIEEPVAPTAPVAPEPAPRAPRRNGRRVVILAVVLVALAAAGYAGYNYVRDTQRYVSTDDALVDSNLVPIAAPSGGTLVVWQIHPGDSVRAGEVIGTVRPAPTGANAPLIDVKAPQDGTVLKVDGKEGQVIGTAQTVAYLANLDHLSVTAYVDETEVHRLRLGQNVDVTVDGTGGTVYHGTVREIIPAVASQFALIQTVDRGTGNFTKVTQRVEVHIDMGDTTSVTLYPGMNAYVRISVS